MQEVMRLMQTGDLQAATAAIRRGLQGQQDVQSPSAFDGDSDRGALIIEGDWNRMPDASDPTTGAPASKDRGDPDPIRDSDGSFRSHRFVCAAGAIDYKLFVPDGLGATTAPLIVMLHGCTQSPDDFARGTRMNTFARE
ncbi:MAG TPA: PHB depolymerase family esterase, partial [Casimicrobiaceae bacterium]|nr:PHB depolymerase family esterase [Casimicrobiaceae bacterium]